MKIFYNTYQRRILVVMLISVLSCSVSFSQSHKPNASNNGTYNLLFPERGLKNKTTKTKILEFGNHNGVDLLAIAACQKCIPAMYTYKEENSKALGRAVFFNSTGLWVFQYDEESFIIVMLDPNAKEWTNFYFSNFYSKSKAKVDAMNQAKIKDFVSNL